MVMAPVLATSSEFNPINGPSDSYADKLFPKSQFILDERKAQVLHKEPHGQLSQRFTTNYGG